MIDVARLDRGARRHVLGAGNEPDHVNRRLEPAQHLEGAEHGGGAGHVVLHVLHVLRRLDRDAAGIEGDTLPHQHDRRAIGALVLQHDEPRLLGAALRHREQRAHLLPHDGRLVQHGDRDARAGRPAPPRRAPGRSACRRCRAAPGSRERRSGRRRSRRRSGGRPRRRRSSDQDVRPARAEACGPQPGRFISRNCHAPWASPSATAWPASVCRHLPARLGRQMKGTLGHAQGAHPLGRDGGGATDRARD